MWYLLAFFRRVAQHTLTEYCEEKTKLSYSSREHRSNHVAEPYVVHVVHEDNLEAPVLLGVARWHIFFTTVLCHNMLGQSPEKGMKIPHS